MSWKYKASNKVSYSGKSYCSYLEGRSCTYDRGLHIGPLDTIEQQLYESLPSEDHILHDL